MHKLTKIVCFPYPWSTQTWLQPRGHARQPSSSQQESKPQPSTQSRQQPCHQREEQKSTKPKWEHAWLINTLTVMLLKCTSPPPQSQQTPAQQAAQQSVSAAAASATWPTDPKEKREHPKIVKQDQVQCPCTNNETVHCRSLTSPRHKKYNVSIYYICILISKTTCQRTVTEQRVTERTKRKSNRMPNAKVTE